MSTLNDADAAAITAVLDGMIEAWNRHDMDAFVAGMSDEVHWVNVVGHYWESRAAVHRAHSWMHRTMFRNVEQRSGPIELRPLSDDVVVAVRTTQMDGYERPDGGTMPPSEARLTLVFVREPEGWRIVHGQVTNVDPRATAFDPAKATATNPA